MAPAETFYGPDFNEFLITYEDVRRAASPLGVDRVRAADARGGRGAWGWNGAELERVEP